MWRRDRTDAVTEWVSRHAVPLRAVHAGAGFEELAPLEETLRRVRVVGLGEATHGSRELFLWKHRALEFLVERMGFRVFAIEASAPACLAIDEYVLGGDVDPAEALAGLGFWTWDTEEVSALIEWLRGRNLGRPEGDKVRFRGFDMQRPGDAVGEVEEFLRAAAPERVAAYRAATGALEPEWWGKRSHDSPERVGAAAELESLLAFLTTGAAERARATPAAKLERVKEHVRILCQLADVASRPLENREDPADTAAGARDVHMARNVERLLASEPPGTRAALWAHNGHVSRAELMPGVPSMGSRLRRVYGDEYYALGLTFGRGRFRAREEVRAGLAARVAEAMWRRLGWGGRRRPRPRAGPVVGHEVGPSIRGSVEWQLARTGLERFWIDFRGSPADAEVERWLTTPRPMRSIGAVHSRRWGFSSWAATAPSLAYDGLVYFESTTSSRPNPSGLRSALL